MENVAPQFVAKSGIVESHFILFFVIFTLFLIGVNFDALFNFLGQDSGYKPAQMKKMHTFYQALKSNGSLNLLEDRFNKYGNHINFSLFRFDFADFRNLDREVIHFTIFSF